MSNIENLSRKKLFRIKSESIVDFLKEKVSLEKCKSIEIFGGEGVNDSIFSKNTKSLEIWEIDSSLKPELEKNVPNAKIRFCDSIKNLNENNDFGFFDLILIDNPMSVFGKKFEYCEHFDAIKNISKLIDKEVILIFLINKKPFFKKDEEKNVIWKERRRLFYGDLNSNDLSIDFLLNFYKELFRNMGFDTIFSKNIPRHTPHLDYMIFKLKRKNIDEDNMIKHIDWISLTPFLNRDK